ncbi:MAG: hypothetical protein E6698_01755 [Finegoldia magna]|nr:hypothetical protein [Finegoldia magna]
MKLKISQKELLKHINIAQKAVSSRTTIQILEGILFIAEENCLRLVATDLELIDLLLRIWNLLWILEQIVKSTKKVKL